MQSSKGTYRFIRAIELIFIIQGRVYEKVVNTYLRSENIAILWRKSFIKIANDRDDVSNRPKGTIQHCCGTHFCNSIKKTQK